MTCRLVILLSALAIAAMPMVAHAQSTVPPSTGGEGSNPMLAVCSGFLAQGAGSVSGDKAKLCGCLVRETSTKLSKADMEAYAEATLNNQPPPQAVMEKVLAIAARCLREAR